MTRSKLLIFKTYKDLYKYTIDIDTYYFKPKTIEDIFLARDPDAVLILTEYGEKIRVN